MFNKIRDRITRSHIVIVAFILMFTILAGRLFNLQIVNGQNYYDGYKLQIQKTKTVTGTRGNIYDKNGKVLAYNELAYSVTIEDNGDYETRNEKNKVLNDIISNVINIVEKNGDAIINDFGIVLDYDNKYTFVQTSETGILRFVADVYGKATIDELTTEQKNSTASDIISYLCGDETYGYGIDEDKTEKAAVLKLINIRYAIGLNSYQKYLETTIAEDVSDKTVAEIMENLDDLQGVEVTEDSLRRYNDSEAFASLIGYTGQISSDEYNDLSDDVKDEYSLNDVVGKSGLEKVLDNELKGKSGENTLYVNNVGKVIDSEEGTSPEAGNDIYLTLDYDLQVATYKILEQQIAGIVLSRIQNVLYLNQNNISDNTEIIIPIGDVYNALISNNVLSLRSISSEDAKETESEVNAKFSARKTEVIDGLKTMLNDPNAASYNDSSDEMQDYMDYIVTTMLTETYQVLVNSNIDKNDETYKQWKDGSVSAYTFLNYAISKNWVNTSLISSEEDNEKYSDSAELYKDLIEYIFQLLESNNGFNKIVYKYMIYSEQVTGRELCMMLYEQEVLPFDQEQYDRLKNGTLGSYDFIRGKIETLDITPGQLALEPCSGSIVITDPNSGDTLACVSYPGYDNNRLANTMDSDYYNKLVTDGSRPFYNKATQEVTAPGSTYKPLVAIAGLTEGVIDTGSSVVCNGEFTRVTPSLKCWVYPSSHGGENVTQAIADSCNVFFSEVGYRLSQKTDETANVNQEDGSIEQTTYYSSTTGTNTLAKYAQQFGLGDTSGLEITENAPKISDESSVPSSIGQGTNSFTTSQLAKYINTIANRGTVYDLTLLDKVTDAKGNTVKEYENKVDNTVELPDSTWNAVQAGMGNVINNNFSSVFRDLTGAGISVASKSGTAQQSMIDPDHALFVGYAPAESPELTFAIRITNGYTSTYTAEVASDVLRYYFGTSPVEEIITGTAKDLSTTSVSHTD
ncbi:MAG: penicillin-binding transpeptidase domain-containing protein [Suipraeoptans sp.]